VISVQPTHVTPRFKAARWNGMLCAFVAAAALSACAHVATSATTEEIVHDRAQTRWNAQVAGDWEKAYSLFAPSYRAVVSSDAHRARLGAAAKLTEAEVTNVVCEAEVCTVRVRLGFAPVLKSRALPVESTHFEERWVLEEGHWWLFQGL
jgi:hypothetical protein